MAITREEAVEQILDELGNGIERTALALACLGAFAAVWQRVLRRRSLTSAYAWRGVVFLWAFLWAALFFGERVTANNVAGAGIILCGMLLAGGDE